MLRKSPPAKACRTRKGRCHSFWSLGSAGCLVFWGFIFGSSLWRFCSPLPSHHNSSQGTDPDAGGANPKAPTSYQALDGLNKAGVVSLFLISYAWLLLQPIPSFDRGALVLAPWGRVLSGGTGCFGWTAAQVSERIREHKPQAKVQRRKRLKNFNRGSPLHW